MTRLASRLLQCPIALVSLVDTDRQWFKSRVGLDATETPRESAFCAHAILEDAVFAVENATADPRFAGNPLVTGDPSIRFYAGAPVRSPAGHRLGTLCVIDDSPRSITTSERDTLRDLAELIEREIAQASVAVTDPLTGLHNRRGFATAATQLLAMARRSGEPVVLAYVDLDGLKQVNDNAGHQVGDLLIRSAASLMRETVREADVVARMGGDEFALLLNGASASTVNAPFSRLHRAVAQHNRNATHEPSVSLSIGWAEWDRQESLDELLERADAAMYERKRSSAASRSTSSADS